MNVLNAISTEVGKKCTLGGDNDLKLSDAEALKTTSQRENLCRMKVESRFFTMEDSEIFFHRVAPKSLSVEVYFTQSNKHIPC